MTPLRRAVAALALAPVVSGCSFGLFQTAHTQPPGTVSATVGVTRVVNEIDDEGGRDDFTNLGFQPGVRVGLVRRVDVGLGSFFLSGARADVKVNVLDPKQPLALAPRAGVGAQYKYGVFMVEAGAIASYRFQDLIEPYFGLTFANHWIGDYPPSQPLPPNLAPGTGTGDGLLQAALGLELDTKHGVGFIAEYGHWFVLNNDPGDFYAFVPTDILAIAVRIGAVRSH